MVIYTPHLIYYVYAYLRKDGTPYYIGKGKDKRALDKNHSVSVPNDKSKIIILEANLTELGSFALERRMIRWYGRKDIGTGILRNLTDGGEGTSGLIRSEETRLKLSVAQKGRVKSEKHKLNLSQSAKGRVHSEETRLKMSESRKGRALSEETRLKLSNLAKIRGISSETRLKMAASLKGRIVSDETRLKMSESRKGRGREISTETRLKMSNIAKGRYSNEEHKLKMAEAISRTWNLIDPNGNKLTIKNLSKFCRENNLSASLMSYVLKGERKHHKGWMKF